MKSFDQVVSVLLVVFCMSFLPAGCAEEGKAGVEALDCGAHGTEHDGHCHCDDGYLVDGATCVTPDKIAAVCEEEPAESGAVEGDAVEEDHAAGHEEHELSHAACLCPADGDCPCDHGTVKSFGAKEYCVPEMHEE
ncbi:MAG: hypothetical protein FJ109_01465 [Deltaproteobacteria bacterium]|nr:hypothetical protein [Deltaproteobacteria bacterium]